MDVRGIYMSMTRLKISIMHRYTIFGKVIDGWDTLDELEKIPVTEKTYKPLTEIRIKDVTIHANPIADLSEQ